MHNLSVVKFLDFLTGKKSLPIFVSEGIINKNVCFKSLRSLVLVPL